MADKNGLYFIIDGTNDHCGITDRLKAAVGLYYIAKEHGIGYHFIHKAGFDIRDYLEPNRVPWSAEPGDVSRLPWRRTMIEYRPPYTGFPDFRADRQYVCRSYVGKNVIEMRGVPDWEKVWRGLFSDLFVPGERVLKALEAYEMPERYTVVNARFINSLGNQEDAGYNSPFPEDVQRCIIEAVLEKIRGCAAESEDPVVVYSDSVRFLGEAAKAGFAVCDPKGVGHIMNRGISETVVLNTFVYMFQMARAQKIYSVLHLDGLPENSLYKSQYPRYAAIIGDRPFVRL